MSESPDEVEVDSYGNPWPVGESRVEFLERVGATSDRPVDEAALRRILRIATKYLSR